MSLLALVGHSFFCSGILPEGCIDLVSPVARFFGMRALPLFRERRLSTGSVIHLLERSQGTTRFHGVLCLHHRIRIFCPLTVLCWGICVCVFSSFPPRGLCKAFRIGGEDEAVRLRWRGLASRFFSCVCVPHLAMGGGFVASVAAAFRFEFRVVGGWG